MPPERVRYTARLRLEPIGPGHALDLWRLFQDPAVAAWYGQWTLEMAQREAARIGAAWQAEGVHKWLAYQRQTGALVGRGGLSRTRIEGQERLEIGRAGLVVAFDELNAAEVVSYTEARNTRSRAVMERLGFHCTHDITLDDGGEPFAFYVLGRPPGPTSTLS